MKILITSLFMAFGGTAIAQQFTITGSIDQPKAGAQVFMSIRTPNSQLLDSTKVVNGVFSFAGQANGPTMVYLVYDQEGKGWDKQGYQSDRLGIYVEEGKTTLSVKDSIKTAEVRGTAIQTAYQQYRAMLSESEEGINRINEEYRNASVARRQDTAFANPLRAAYAKYAAQKDKLQTDYILANPASHFSLLALQDFVSAGKDILVLESDFEKLAESVRHSEIGQSFAKQIVAAKATAIGAVAPDFTQNDVNDNPVSLSDFRGKYVFLDFWASWCGPCRAENPNVVAAYEQFKDKNFTVLGVSLDQPGKKENWLKAIEADKLTWTNVSDLKFWDNAAAKLYGVRGIPQNYLIDPSGKIVAKDLHGKQLHEKLAELLN